MRKIFMDGGYKNKRCSWAFFDEQANYVQYGMFLTKEADYGGLLGELKAVAHALNYLKNNEVREATLHTDHMGIYSALREPDRFIRRYLDEAHVDNDTVKSTQAEIAAKLNYFKNIGGEIFFLHVSKLDTTMSICDELCTRACYNGKPFIQSKENYL